MKSRHQIMRARTYENLGHFLEQKSINGAVIVMRWEVKSEFAFTTPFQSEAYYTHGYFKRAPGVSTRYACISLLLIR